VAEVVGLELRNVAANYPFERSHRFAGIQPNSSYRDYSRLKLRRWGNAARVSCGRDLPRGVMRRRWLSSGIAVRHELTRFLPIQDAPPAAKPATPCSVCAGVTVVTGSFRATRLHVGPADPPESSASNNFFDLSAQRGSARLHW
jgi:hypothetical protein